VIRSGSLLAQMGMGCARKRPGVRGRYALLAHVRDGGCAMRSDRVQTINTIFFYVNDEYIVIHT